MITCKISTEKIEGRQFILTQICFQWTCVISVFVTSYILEVQSRNKNNVFESLKK